MTWVQNGGEQKAGKSALNVLTLLFSTFSQVVYLRTNKQFVQTT